MNVVAERPIGQCFLEENRSEHVVAEEREGILVPSESTEVGMVHLL